jgi:tRNA dimethylallyltransferase
MTIGTAVPSTTELTAAPHHFIKINPYLRTIPLVILRKTRLKKSMNFLTNDYAILVGGSGLYVNAVLKG